MIIRIFARYISKNILLATALSAVVILGVTFLITLLGELKSIGHGDYGIVQAFIYVLLRLPGEFYKFSPMIILLGSILGLSVLATHRELAVMRASGFSTRRIFRAVLSAAFILMLIITFLGEWLAPPLNYWAEVRKENAQHGGQAVVTGEGVWFRIDNNFIHVEQVINRQLLEGITHYQFDDNNRLLAAVYAKALLQQQDQWVLRDAVKTVFTAERTKSQHFAALPWHLKLNANMLNVGLVEPSEMSLHRLARFSQYLVQNGLRATEYQFQFWQRLLQPLACLIMVFLAIPFVLSAFSTSTLGWRVVAGILCGLAFYILNALFAQLCIVLQLPALLAALLPLLVFAMIGGWLSRKIMLN